VISRRPRARMDMSPSITELPTDPDDLRRIASDLQRDVAALSAEIYTKTLLIEKLKMQLAVLRRSRFGRSSEKLDRAVEQLELLIGDIEESQAEIEAKAEAAAQSDTLGSSPSKRRRRPSGRTPLPDHLPQEVITTSQNACVLTCGGEKFSRLAPTNARCSNMSPRTSKRVLHIRPK